MESEDKLKIETAIVEALKTVYDPEIPVNVYDLGLIYEIDVNDESHAKVTMTLTAPNCPMADELLAEVQFRTENVEGVKSASVNLTFNPTWEKEMMSEEAMLELGLL